MLRYLSISLFIFASLCFDTYSPDRCTNCSIMYFSLTWTAIFLISLENVFIVKSIPIMLGSILTLPISGYFILNELLKIDMNYDLYMHSVNLGFASQSLIFFKKIFIVILIFEFIRKFLK